MTVHVLLVDPPREGLVLRDLVESTPLSAAAGADLYAAMAKDAMAAAAASGGDLLVNYPPADLLPDETPPGEDPEAAVRALARDALDDLDPVRFEVQVGSTVAARAGNAATHLLREEDAGSVAVLDPTVPTLGRTALDGAAMKLRRSQAVIAPAPRGRVAYLGLVEPIDFEDAYAPPALSTLVERCLDAGHDVDFVPMQPRLDSAADLVSLVTTVRARRAAGRIVPEFTAAVLDRLGVGVAGDPVGITVEDDRADR